MIEAFTDQFAGGQQDAWCICRKCMQFRDDGCSLFLRHPAVQHERRWNLAVQGGLDGVEMLSTLGEHQYLATLPERPADFGRDGIGPLLVIGEVTEHVLNTSLPGQVDACD